MQAKYWEDLAMKSGRRKCVFSAVAANFYADIRLDYRQYRYGHALSASTVRPLSIECRR